jgi:hypothetical protein
MADLAKLQATRIAGAMSRRITGRTPPEADLRVSAFGTRG